MRKLLEKLGFIKDKSIQTKNIIFGIIIMFLVVTNVCSGAHVYSTSSKMTEMEKQLSEIEEQKDALMNENVDLSDQLETLGNSKAEVDAELNEANEKLESLQDQSDTIADLNAKNEELQNQITSLQNSLDEKNAEIAAASSSNGSSDTNDNGSTISSSYTVYITKTGSKYHRSGCRYLKQSQISISKSDAEAQGYDACSVCNP